MGWLQKYLIFNGVDPTDGGFSRRAHKTTEGLVFLSYHVYLAGGLAPQRAPARESTGVVGGGGEGVGCAGLKAGGKKKRVYEARWDTGWIIWFDKGNGVLRDILSTEVYGLILNKKVRVYFVVFFLFVVNFCGCLYLVYCDSKYARIFSLKVFKKVYSVL